MTGALTPELAIAYVRELSADVRGAVVLAADGSLLAGPAQLAAPARAYLAATGDEPDVATRLADGLVLAARTAVHVIVVAAGPLSLVGPTALDARAAADALAAAPPPRPAAADRVAERSAATTPQQAAEAVISALQQAI